MKRRLTWKIVLLGALLLALLAPPAAGQGAAVERPWGERTTGDSIVDFANCDLSTVPIVTCPIRLEYTVTGTYVGRADLVAVGHAIFDQSQTCVRSDGAIGSPGRTVSEEVIVAADGSALHSHTVYEYCVGGFPNEFAATRMILGGTGRFEGASGSVELVGVDQGGPTDMTGEGTITY